MNLHEDIANRHVLPVEGLSRSRQDEPLSVRIVVSAQWAASRAGQLLVSCLANLLVRQVSLVRQVEIASSPAPSLVRIPTVISSRDFPGSLVSLSDWAVDGVVPVIERLIPDPADFTIFVGTPLPEPIPNHGQVLTALGDGWRAWVGTPDLAPQGVLPSSGNPLGPFLAAALIAGEVFKRSRGILRGRYLTAEGFSLWSNKGSSAWGDLDPGPEIAGHVLRPLHIVGLGAVGNALAYIIANLQLSEAYPVLIDDDKYDETNLNRCLLAGWPNRNDLKVGAVYEALNAAGIDAYPFEGNVTSYVTDARRGLRENVARRVETLDFEIVASCVDRGLSRQHVQGLRPRLLLGGSTLNLQAKSNLYSGRPGAACLACFNPAERDGEKVRSLESRLRNMLPQDRRGFLEANGLDARAIEDYLLGAPCGGLGEAAIREFAIRPPAQFSAGFVSLGAGLLLGTSILRSSIFQATAPPVGDMVTLNFLNGGMIDVGLGADENCEMQCQSRSRACNA